MYKIDLTATWASPHKGNSRFINKLLELTVREIKQHYRFRRPISIIKNKELSIMYQIATILMMAIRIIKVCLYLCDFPLIQHIVWCE